MVISKCTRDVLYCALSINLAMDCCGRISEIIAPRNLDDGDRCLRWGDIELYAFRHKGRVSLRARVD